jgi:hypothetical protein
VADNLFSMENGRATGETPRRVFPHGQYAVSLIEGGGRMVSVQVADFSPVITNFHDFRPISQLQGFGFSPVTGFPGILFICGRQSLHPLKWGIRNAETSASSVELCGIPTGAILGYPTRSHLRFFWEEQGWAEHGWRIMV